MSHRSSSKTAFGLSGLAESMLRVGTGGLPWLCCEADSDEQSDDWMRD